MQRTCPRCELDTMASKGIFNLRIKDVRLGEDEHFECQVSPGKGAINSVPLRAPVKINIQGKFGIYVTSFSSISSHSVYWSQKRIQSDSIHSTKLDAYLGNQI